MAKKQIQCNKNVLSAWMFWAKSYFCSAFIICDRAIELIQNRKDDKNKNQTLFYKYKCSLGGQYLLMPIIYNFNHGTELYLKFLGNLIDQNYESNHDRLDLYEKLIKKIENSKKCNKDVKNHIEKTLPFIKKYQRLNYLPSLEYTLSDESNMVERYPETKINFTYPEIFKNGKSFIDAGYLQDIKKDIGTTLKIFNNVQVKHILYFDDNNKIICGEINLQIKK